jgi:hypothetical protein
MARVGGGRLTGGAARSGSVLGEGVVDGEAPGTGGVSGEGSNRRRASAAAHGSGDGIGRLQWLMSMGEWLRRSRGERGAWCCEEINSSWSPFIGAEGCRGCCGKSTMARALRRCREVGEGGVLFRVSRWFSGWRRLG